MRSFLFRVVTGTSARLAFMALISSAAAPFVQATPVLRIQLNSDTPTECTDNDVCDTESTSGVIGLLGSFGGIGVNVTGGLSKPAHGSALQPYLDLNSSNTNIPANSTLRILFSDTDFLAAPVTFVGGVGGTVSGGQVTFTSYLDESNTPFGTATAIGSTGTFGAGPFSGSFSHTTVPTGPYSLTQQMLIQFTDTGSFAADFELSTETSAVPEPATGLLVGAALLMPAVRRSLIRR